MKRALRRIVKPSVISVVLILAGMVSLVAFADTFGLRWALLAAVPCLTLLGVAAGVDR